MHRFELSAQFFRGIVDRFAAASCRVFLQAFQPIGRIAGFDEKFRHIDPPFV
jgi:hypothetical protein